MRMLQGIAILSEMTLWRDAIREVGRAQLYQRSKTTMEAHLKANTSRSIESKSWEGMMKKLTLGLNFSQIKEVEIKKLNHQPILLDWECWPMNLCCVIHWTMTSSSSWALLRVRTKSWPAKWALWSIQSQVLLQRAQNLQWPATVKLKFKICRRRSSRSRQKLKERNSWDWITSLSKMTDHQFLQYQMNLSWAVLAPNGWLNPPWELPKSRTETHK